MAKLHSLKELRKLYMSPKGRAIDKELNILEKHSRSFIALSPFLIIGTNSLNGDSDVSPRGEMPGFVSVQNDNTLMIPDRPGNNRLDTLSNIIENPHIGLLFLIPGLDETLRINGTAEIRNDPNLLQKFIVSGKLPKTIILVHIKQVYLHCAKALMRSKLWNPDSQIDRAILPSMNRMINEQTASEDSSETDRETRERYLNSLY